MHAKIMSDRSGHDDAGARGPADGISISRCRPKATREDFMVRGYGKRATRVVLMANYDTLESMSKILSEDDLTYLLLAVAAKMNERGWKTGVVNVWLGSGAAKHGRVEMRNPARHAVPLGDLGNLVEIRYLLKNPPNTTHKFWIK